MKSFNFLKLSASAIIFATPILTVSCFNLKEHHTYEEYVSDFSIGYMDSDPDFLSQSPETWSDEWKGKVEEKGYGSMVSGYASGFSFRTTSIDDNKFNIDFVNNFLSSKKNEYWSGNPLSHTGRVHDTVSLLSDSDAGMFSILANGGYLKDIQDIFERFNIDEKNVPINQHIYDIAIENASMEIEGVKQQIGIPHSFKLRGIEIEAYSVFNDNYESGAFDELTISGLPIKNIIGATSSGSSYSRTLSNFIIERGWTWNEMISLGNALADPDTNRNSDQYILMNNESHMPIEGFLFAKRYDENKSLIWDGTSNDWNSDIVKTLESKGLHTHEEIEDAISNMMELVAPSTRAEGRTSSSSVYTVANSSWSLHENLLPMPLYTGGGNDVYTDLVVAPEYLFLPDEDQFFSSEDGIELRNYTLELLLKQTFDNGPIGSNLFYSVSPYTSEEWILSNSAYGKYSEELANIMLSSGEEHSISSTRWVGDWFRNSTINSVDWDSNYTLARDYEFSYNPLNSVDREINLYDKYDLKIT